MAKTKTPTTMLRQPAEIKYREELEYLASIDKGTKPFSGATISSDSTDICLRQYTFAKTCAPRISRFVVELLSKLFAEVPDSILLPWLPSLILRLRPHAQILQTLLKEAAASFPKRLSDFDSWQPSWMVTQSTLEVATQTEEADTLNEQQSSVRQMLFNTRTTTEAIAQLLGVETLTWEEVLPSGAKINSHTNLSQTEAVIENIAEI